MDPIKDAFAKVKQDIDELKAQFLSLSQQIQEIKRTLIPETPAQSSSKPSDSPINPTVQHIPLSNLPFYASETPNTHSSTGNEGVPTDRQTNQQTDQHTPISSPHFQFHSEETPRNSPQNDPIGHMIRVSEVLDSLDSLKKEVRSNFKRLTAQEMTVFSAVYSLEEQGFVVDYPLISQKLSLSESSIRDYVQKIIKKGIPLLKSKENNKKIILSISPELKKIVSLQTILALREI